MPGKLKIITYTLLHLLFSGTISYAQTAKEEKHLLVSLRMIGHQVLLSSGDSTSRVFPIVKEGESYKIQFGTAFAFNPGYLASTIDRVVQEMKAASSYIVEVKRCENYEVVYSYEKGDSVNPELMPCGPRFQPKACYMIFFTVLKRYNLNAGSLYHAAPVQPSFMDNKPEISAASSGRKSVEPEQQSPAVVRNRSAYSLIALPIGSFFAFIGLLVYFRKKRAAGNSAVNAIDPNRVMIGDTAFDQKNMTLLHAGEKIELSSKESDLLSVLFTNVNTTIEREYILKVVWGDEGDYIGRTLDVFVSKLRKKLEPDHRVKIVNIRGIGYKFIVN
jgi:DNA-binding winged helix-turn-helix (wHTH) protein